MDLCTMKFVPDSSFAHDGYFEIDDLVEGWNSLIWTERHFTAGEMILKSPKIEETLSVLSEKKVVTLLDSDQVMIIEDRTVGVDANGSKEVTVTGRAFETVFDTRSLKNSTAPIYKGWVDSPWDVFDTLLRKTFVRKEFGFVGCRAEDVMPGVKPDVRLPRVVYRPIPGKTKPLTTLTGDPKAYTFIQDYAAKQGLGMRSSRSNGPGEISWIVHPGSNRTINQPLSGGVEPVVFNTFDNHFDTSSYLWSNKDYRNIVYIYTPSAFRIYPNSANSLRGFERRVLPVDAGTVNVPAGSTLAEQLDRLAKLELGKHQLTRMFDGTMTSQPPYKYNQDYFLGDRISFLAEYGIQGTAQVEEYIRSQDDTGEKAYPTFGSWDIDE